MARKIDKKKEENVKYKIIYGDGVGVFPKSALDVIKRASGDDVKVLLCLCAHEGNADEKKLAKLTGCKSENVRDALSFWRGAGVIETSEGKAEESEKDTAPEKETPEKETKTQKKKLERSEELPNYTSSELADILEQRSDTATLINECQNILGKVFNVHEINVLIGLVDYLGLDCEYIMILLTYCVSLGKRTLHYAEKMAFALYDAGITTASELSEELRRREVIASTEGRIRTLFGLGERAFTTKEKKMIAAWVGEMGYPIEIIEKAYEVTADATGNASIPYANSVLERWYKEGLRTLEEIAESYKKKENSKNQGESSFDMDDFFAAAVKRALGDN